MEGRLRILGLVLGPEFVDQLVGRDRGGGFKSEEREQCPRTRAGDIDAQAVGTNDLKTA